MGLFKETKHGRKKKNKEDGFDPLESLVGRIGKRKLGFGLLVLAILFVVSKTVFRYMEQVDLLEFDPKNPGNIHQEEKYESYIKAINDSITKEEERMACIPLQFSPDTMEFHGVKIMYSLQDSVVSITYNYEGKTRFFTTVDCDMSYAPGVPRPTWRNERFLGFQSGCGSPCWQNYLAPLTDKDTVQSAGEMLIDTSRAIFITVLKGKVLVDYMMENRQDSFPIQAQDFYGAIFWDDLDYEIGNKQGFTFKNDTLSFYYLDGRIKQIRL